MGAILSWGCGNARPLYMKSVRQGLAQGQTPARFFRWRATTAAAAQNGLQLWPVLFALAGMSISDSPFIRLLPCFGHQPVCNPLKCRLFRTSTSSSISLQGPGVRSLLRDRSARRRHGRRPNSDPGASTATRARTSSWFTCFPMFLGGLEHCWDSWFWSGLKSLAAGGPKSKRCGTCWNESTQKGNDVHKGNQGE